MSVTTLPASCLDISRGTNVVVIETCVTTIVIIISLLRIYVRLRFVKAFGWDDLCMAVAVILYLAVYGMDMQEVNWGVGRHVECTLADDAAKAARYQYISEPLLISSLLFSRFAFCIFLLRLFAIRKSARILVYTIMAIIFIFSAASDAIIIPQCTPRAKLWNQAIPGHCWSPTAQLAVGYLNGALSVICDLAVSLLPIYIIRTIQMPRRLKIAICCLMGLGIFTAICAVVRTVLLGEIKGSDVTYDIVNVTIFAVLEGALGIIAATIPTIGALFMTAKWNHGSTKPQIDKEDQHAFSRALGGPEHLQSTTIFAYRPNFHGTDMRNDSVLKDGNKTEDHLDANEVLRQIDIEIVGS